MQILEILKEYWFLITFLGTFIIAMFSFCMSMIEATKCSLRNDISFLNISFQNVA